jgi:hypothetical protein
MFIYYVYAYLRENGSPYYVGKGKDSRYKEKHSIPLPNDPKRIIFLEKNLSNIGACALERRYIRWYGRQCNASGILLNQTEGGDGGDTSLSAAYIKAKNAGHFNGHKHKSAKCLEEANIKRRKTLMGHEVSQETRQKLRDAKLGKCYRRGFKITEEHKDKLRQPREKFTCENCNQVVGGKTNYIRWHGINCKKCKKGA